jgi:hypothetical protein
LSMGRPIERWLQLVMEREAQQSQLRVASW